MSTTASLGPVTATLRGTTSGSFSQSWSGVTLTVVTGGNTVLSAAVTPPAGPGAGSPSPGVTPWFIGPSPSPASTPPAQVLEGDPLCLARFAGQSRPTVLLGMTLGGAHCCTVVRAFAVGPSSVVPPVDIDLGNPGATITAHAGGALVVTADNDFAYAFASFAGSGMPIRVYQFDAGKFVDTTRQHLDLVAADEATWWQGFTRDPSNGLGLLAAWVADECVLGRATSAWSVVDQYQAQGKLSGLPPWPSGAAYVQQLHAFLFKHGYCPAA